MESKLAEKPKGPTIEAAASGTCEIQKCPNDAKYSARWALVKPKRICEKHKKFVEGKSWSDVSGAFGHYYGNIPPGPPPEN